MVTKKKLNYKEMPPAQGERSGIKVGWYYYKDEATAKKAAVVARHNAAIDESLGYDFGYCSPGSIRVVGPDAMGEWKPYIGMYEVCVS